MSIEGSHLSSFLANEGGLKCFVDALLLLDPEDLKACRQVPIFIFVSSNSIQVGFYLVLREDRCKIIFRCASFGTI